MDIVCVTGATGFLGSYVVKELLARGFHVRAAVRDPADRAKARHLLDLDGADSGLTLVPGDLEKQGSFDAGAKGARYVIHTASATVLAAKDPQREIIDVAVMGTKNVLASAVASPSVERVVLTSSVAAVAGDVLDPSHVFDESDWNEGATVKNDPYACSKVQAERAAWAIIRGSRVSMTALLPSLVLGPVLAEQHLRTSPAVLFEVIRGAWPGVPDLHFQVVDVRDVAKAHVEAMLKRDAPERIIVSADAAGLRWMAGEVRCAFPPETYPQAKTPSLAMPDAVMYAVALFEKRLTFGFLRRNLGHAPRFDNRRLLELGVTPRSVRESVLDTARSMIQGGYLRSR